MSRSNCALLIRREREHQDRLLLLFHQHILGRLLGAHEPGGVAAIRG